MKYELKVDQSGGVILVDEEHEELLCIYWSGYKGYENHGWPEGFWYSPDWCANSIGRDRDANVDYHEHREEYIAEAKKLLVKEML